MGSRIFGYARISTLKQHIQRQIDNIKDMYPDALIIEETYTGTTTDRPAWNKLYKQLQEGDTVIFDEVSRMSRSAAEGVKLYEELFERGVNMIFIKEPHVNSSVYRDKLQKQVERISGTGSEATDKLLNSIMDALHEFTIDLAREQIRLAFQTAQSEVDYMRQRTSEGVQKAKERYAKETILGIPHEKNNVGRAAGSKIETKKAKAAKVIILKHSKTFGGTLADDEVQKLAGVSRNTYYRLKKELKEA